MGKEKGYRNLREEIRAYLEFQRAMGVKALGVKSRRPSPPSPPPREQAGLPEPLMPRKSLEEIREELGECTRCKLSEGRTSIVFGEGNPKARIVFVGEGPGADEDAQGRPFVGRAGKLLNRIIKAMGFEREDVYICNVVKCRPPQNRNPEPDEMQTCEPFMFAQLRAIEPEVIICLGAVSAHSVLKLKKKVSLGSLRQQFFPLGKSKVMVTYHPAALLRNPNYKKPLWEDMKIALREMGLKPPVE